MKKLFILLAGLAFTTVFSQTVLTQSPQVLLVGITQMGNTEIMHLRELM
jgi:hypothetical protein